MGHKIKMLVEVGCEDMAFSLDDPESVQWFCQEVLMNQTDDGALYLHSNEIGDTVGRVRVLVVHDWPPSRDTPNARLDINEGEAHGIPLDVYDATLRHSVAAVVSG